MKQHLEDDDLILHFYGETGAAAEPHLSDCVDCRARYQALQRVLNVAEAPPVPYRSPSMRAKYGTGSRRNSDTTVRSSWLSPRRWVPVMAAAALLVDRILRGSLLAASHSRNEVAQTPCRSSRESVLLVAVGDHLERSEMLLIEIANANPEQVMNLPREGNGAGFGARQSLVPPDGGLIGR